MATEKRGANIRTTAETNSISYEQYGATAKDMYGHIYKGFLGDATDVNPSEVRFGMDHDDSILVIVDSLPLGTTLVACAYDVHATSATGIYGAALSDNCECTYRVTGEDAQWTPIDLGGLWSISRSDTGEYSKNMMLVPLITNLGFYVYNTLSGELLLAGDLHEVVVRYNRTRTKVIVPATAWPGGN